jgi:hypothetical protein
MRSHTTMPAVCCALAAIALLAGCALNPTPAPSPTPTQGKSDGGEKVAEVQLAVMGFADRFIPAVAEACDYIEQNAKTPETRSAAKGRKTGASLAALKNAVNPNPYAGLLDMVVMVTLLADTVDSPVAKELYGPYGQRLSATLALQRDDVWAMAAKFVTDAQLQELRGSIKTWRDAHQSAQYVAFVRITDLPETRQLQQSSSADRRASSVFGLLFLDPLANLDPAVREFQRSRLLAERSFFYLQRLSMIAAWQADQVGTDILTEPEVQTAVSAGTTIAGSTTRFADIGDRVTETVSTFERDLPTLRNDTIDQTEHAVARQRDAAIQQATTQISAERDAAIRQLGGAVRNEQEEFTRNLHGLVDHAIDRLSWRAALLIIGGLVVAVIYRFVVRRLPRGRGINRPPTANASTEEEPLAASPGGAASRSDFGRRR